MSEPVYVGGGWKHPKFEGCLKFGFKKEHLETMLKNLDEKGWVNILISPKRDDPEKYYAKLDTFEKKRVEEEKKDDLPF